MRRRCFGSRSSFSIASLMAAALQGGIRMPVTSGTKESRDPVESAVITGMPAVAASRTTQENPSREVGITIRSIARSYAAVPATNPLQRTRGAFLILMPCPRKARPHQCQTSLLRASGFAARHSEWYQRLPSIQEAHLLWRTSA